MKALWTVSLILVLMMAVIEVRSESESDHMLILQENVDLQLFSLFYIEAVLLHVCSRPFERNC